MGTTRWIDSVQIYQTGFVAYITLAFTMPTIEIRTYRLKPGTSAQFEAAMQNALPMVRAKPSTLKSPHTAPLHRTAALFVEF